MDRSSELHALIASFVGAEGLSPSPTVISTPFVSKCGNLLFQIEAFDRLLDSCYDAYVDYHRFLNNDSSSMLEVERKQLGQEIALLIAGVTGEVQALRRIAPVYKPRPENNERLDGIAALSSSLLPSSSTSSVDCHYAEILSFLTLRLGNFTRRSQGMQRERERVSKNPFSLSAGAGEEATGEEYFSPYKISAASAGGSEGGVDHIPTTAAAAGAGAVAGRLLVSLTSSAGNERDPTVAELGAGVGGGGGVGVGVGGGGGGGGGAAKKLSKSFVERYEGEVAPAAKLREYSAVAERHRSLLLREAKGLQVRFGEDLSLMMKAESSVHHISGMLSEFVSILQTQAGQADTIYDAGKSATEQVDQTDLELKKTEDLSVSHQRNIVILTVVFALLLLFLDWITP